uniref:Uncharacterized protein n=1 Tax=Gasterosteus aculeatus aculeatus TaxID=481459 RepID=A0AAQ4PK22_GASAC
MVTDNAVYIGTDFAINTGVGLVVKMKNSPEGSGVLEDFKAAFERDWRSRYAKSLQGHKDHHQGKHFNSNKVSTH